MQNPRVTRMIIDGAHVRALQGGLKERGFDIGTTQSCVTPVYLKGKYS